MIKPALMQQDSRRWKRRLRNNHAQYDGFCAHRVQRTLGFFGVGNSFGEPSLLGAEFSYAGDVSFLEPDVRDRLRKQLQRGKVDCTLQFQSAVNREAITVDAALVQRYVQAAGNIQALLNNPAPMNAVDFISPWRVV